MKKPVCKPVLRSSRRSVGPRPPTIAELRAGDELRLINGHMAVVTRTASVSSREGEMCICEMITGPLKGKPVDVFFENVGWIFGVNMRGRKNGKR